MTEAEVRAIVEQVLAERDKRRAGVLALAIRHLKGLVAALEKWTEGAA